MAEDHGHDEDVVYRQAPFDQVAGGELKALLSAHEPVDAGIESECDGNVAGAGGQPFTDGNLMGTTVEHAQIEREKYQDEGVEAHPYQGRCFHRALQMRSRPSAQKQVKESDIIGGDPPTRGARIRVSGA